MTRRKVQCPEAQEARRLGKKRYFTGKPCAKGHVADRYVSDETCHACRNEGARRNRARDPEKYNAHTRKWRAENPETMSKSVRRWLVNNRMRVRVKSRERYRSNPEPKKISARNWRALHPDKVRASLARWARANPTRQRAAIQNARAKRAAAPGSHTGEDVLRIFKAQKGRCAYCRTSLRRKVWHLDHIVALARGGTNYPANLQILRKSCNHRKHAKDPIYFAQEMGLLI